MGWVSISTFLNKFSKSIEYTALRGSTFFAWNTLHETFDSKRYVGVKKPKSVNNEFWVWHRWRTPRIAISNWIKESISYRFFERVLRSSAFGRPCLFECHFIPWMLRLGIAYARIPLLGHVFSTLSINASCKPFHWPSNHRWFSPFAMSHELDRPIQFSFSLSWSWMLF